MTRVSVVTQGGKLLGVYVPPAPPADPRAPVAYLVAGRGPVIVEVEVAVPAALEREKDVKAFHAEVAKKLKARRKKK